MSNEIKTISLALLFFVSMILSAASPAQTAVGPINLTQVNTGWNSDEISVGTGAPAINPATCPMTDLYVTESGAPGNRSHYAAALTALANGLAVVIVVANQGCSSDGRPKIWGITIYKK
ncbi:hypothetical protein [Dyella subtropica]|uniref:hypothetical protein n=1 Tax=Dyella subtropica TaxID=2992127 RepID=UPI00225726F2|nr:hypothetical protein [Dyella subtropica]